jgi:hypothetical protein
MHLYISICTHVVRVPWDMYPFIRIFFTCICIVDADHEQKTTVMRHNDPEAKAYGIFIARTFRSTYTTRK